MQQGLGLFGCGQPCEVVERGEFLVGLTGVEFGQFEGAEGVDACEGPGPK
ncbi:hypothetical protein SCALM49S_09770 [Streptomyces californicus]